MPPHACLFPAACIPLLVHNRDTSLLLCCVSLRSRALFHSRRFPHPAPVPLSVAGYCPLHSLLAERGAEVDSRDPLGWTPLHKANQRGIVRESLLFRGETRGSVLRCRRRTYCNLTPRSVLARQHGPVGKRAHPRLRRNQKLYLGLQEVTINNCSLRGCIRKNWNDTEKLQSWNNMSHDHMTSLTPACAPRSIFTRKIFSPDPSMAPAQG